MLNLATIVPVGFERAGLSFYEEMAANPKLLWGKTEKEVGDALGEGWIRDTYGSNEKGWKFFNKAHPDQSIFYHAGGGLHGGSYYGLTGARYGRNKVVNPATYKPSWNDKANIFHIYEH